MLEVARNEWDVKDTEIIGPSGPDPKELRAAALDKRRQAASRIAELEKEYTPKIKKAAAALTERDRELTAAREVLQQSELAAREARQICDSLEGQLSNLIGEQRKIIWENRDAELRALISRLDEALWTEMQHHSASRRANSRVEKLKNAIQKAKELECDPGIINVAKLELALAAVWASGGVS